MSKTIGIKWKNDNAKQNGEYKSFSQLKYPAKC